MVGSANLNWPELGFEFRETKSHMKFCYKNGAWDEGQLVEGEPYIKVSTVGATSSPITGISLIHMITFSL